MTWQQDNHDYWQAHKHEYPFHAVHNRLMPADDTTRPEQLNTHRHGHFLRVPTGDAVFWGFETEASRDRFIQDFGGEILIEGETP